MISAEHAAARDRAELVSMLYASEGSIYGRFGYGVACQTAAWVVDLKSTRIHDAAGGRAGSVELLAIDDAAVDVAHLIFERARRAQPGEMWRRPITWKSDFGLAGQSWGDTWKGFLAVHRAEDGTPDGYARYHADQKWEQRQARSTLTVDDLHADTPDVEVALLRFLFDVDLVATLRIESRTPTDRLPWLLTNPRAAHADEVGDGLWVMLHDVAGALTARTYERSGSIVLEVAGSGPQADERTRIALDVGPDGAEALATDRSPDLTVHASALGAAYLGGSRLRDAVLAMGYEEHQPGALAAADALLVCRDAPWCSTFF
jgi:predicted acetyltransferase